MRRFITGLLMFCLIFLVACGSNNKAQDNIEATTPKDESINQSENDEQEEQVEDNQSNENDVEEKTNVASEDLGTPMDSTEVKRVIEEVDKVIRETNGMSFEGEMKEITEQYGVESDTISEIAGEINFNPFAQYQRNDTESEKYGSQYTEFYVVGSHMFLSEPMLSNEWVELPPSIGVMELEIQEVQFKNFSNHSDLFTLFENNNSYLLVFEGSDDVYNKVIYGGARELFDDQAYSMLANIHEEISGEHIFTIDKETYHVTSISEKLITKSTLGTIVESHTTYNFSNFNEVDEIIVPEDIIEITQ